MLTIMRVKDESNPSLAFPSGCLVRTKVPGKILNQTLSRISIWLIRRLMRFNYSSQNAHFSIWLCFRELVYFPHLLSLLSMIPWKSHPLPEHLLATDTKEFQTVTPHSGPSWSHVLCPHELHISKQPHWWFVSPSKPALYKQDGSCRDHVPDKALQGMLLTGYYSAVCCCSGLCTTQIITTKQGLQSWNWNSGKPLYLQLYLFCRRIA